METKANYVAVGAFVLACVVGLVIALLWLAGAQYSKEFAYYQTYFTGSVTGLGSGTTVRYNGIDVGRVTDVAFDPDDPKKVIATLQIKPDVKIHEDSVASIASQGLTGSAYVEIDGGTKDSPLITETPGRQYPVIRSRPSTIQQLVESAPELVNKLNKISDRLLDVLSDKNRAAISASLANLQETTGILQQHSADIGATLSNFATATKSLNEALEEMHTTLGNVDTMDHNANETATSLNRLANNTNAFVTGEGLAQLSDLISETRVMVTNLSRLSDRLENQPTQLFFGDRRKGYTPK